MCLSSYLELRPCRPRTEKLRDLLSECPYRGPEYEEEEGEGLGNKGEESGEDGIMDSWEGERKTKRRKIDSKRPRKVSNFDFFCSPPASTSSSSVHVLRATGGGAG